MGSFIDRAKTAITRFAGTPEAAEAPTTVETAEANVSDAEHEAAQAARALERAAAEVGAAAAAAADAEAAYVADPNANTDAAVASSAHTSKLAGLRLRAAEQQMQAANAALESARAALEDARAAVVRAELTERSDLAGFNARQAARSEAMIECLDKLRVLAQESDRDFGETNRAAAALGILALDSFHLVADLAVASVPIASDDEVISVRNDRLFTVGGSFGTLGKPSLERTLLEHFDALGQRRYARREDFDYSELRASRTLGEYQQARDARAKAAKEAAVATTKQPPPDTAPAPETSADARDEDAPEGQRAPEFGREWW